MRRYIAQRELKRLQRYGEKQAKKVGIKEKDVQAIVDKYRAEQSID